MSHPCLSPSLDLISRLKSNPNLLSCPRRFSVILLPLLCLLSLPSVPITLVPSLFFAEVKLIAASGPLDLLMILPAVVFPRMCICLLPLSAQVASRVHLLAPYPTTPFLCFQDEISQRHAIWKAFFILCPPKVLLKSFLLNSKSMW